VAKRYFVYTKVSEEVNRKCPARNTMVQLLTPNTDPEHHKFHNTPCHRQTDRQTDNIIGPIPDHTCTQQYDRLKVTWGKKI